MLFSRKIYYCNKPLILTADAMSYKMANPQAVGFLTLTGAFQRNYRMAFEHLAKPRTLGAIRPQYHAQLTSVLVGEIAKDLTGHALKDVEKAIAAA